MRGSQAGGAGWKPSDCATDELGKQMTSGGGTVPYRGSPGSKYTFDSRFTLTSPTLHGGARAGSGAVVVVVGTVVGVVVVVVAAVVDVAVVDVVELGAAVVAAL